MGVSAEVAQWVTALEAVERAATAGIGDDAMNALCDRRERLTLSLAQEPNRAPGDAAAKLAILCRRLRRDAEPGEGWRVANYLLAESARDGA